MELPASLGLRVRRPGEEDAPAIHRLVSAVDTHDLGAVDVSVDDIRDEMGDVDLERDAWLVIDDGASEPIAFGSVTNRGNVVHRAYLVVHPSWRRRGIGTALARALEGRAREQVVQAPDGVEVAMSGWVKGDSRPDKHWAEGLGFSWARRFLRMRIDMREAPPQPAWPDGVAARSFVLGQDEALMHHALEDAFSDHWGHVPAPLEDLIRRTERRDFDAGLWFMAMDGERAVATATNSIIPDQIGWISGLGTVRSHRRRGLARAILLHSFAEFWRRGIRTVALGVDADSLTGATALYESVGMRVEERFDQVRKVLRAGEPLDVRSAG